MLIVLHDSNPWLQSSAQASNHIEDASQSKASQSGANQTVQDLESQLERQTAELARSRGQIVELKARCRDIEEVCCNATGALSMFPCREKPELESHDRHSDFSSAGPPRHSEGTFANERRKPAAVSRPRGEQCSERGSRRADRHAREKVSCRFFSVDIYDFLHL